MKLMISFKYLIVRGNTKLLINYTNYEYENIVCLT